MEAKEEIAQIVNALPDAVAEELLHYLRHLEKASQEKSRLSLHLSTILTEDRELLERLAQ